ncbi:MAG: TerC family protein [Alphaproteobacteria bacterium]|nr:TerC family protein [Alphaproteobacteria bacterium]MDE2335720.1 TerC family protein [Alphaproteobacteria bacterium]
MDHAAHAATLWAGFAGLIAALMALDLGILHKNSHIVGIRESLLYSAGYALIGAAFGGWVWYEMGREAAALYWTGFIVEKTLSIDNIFAISLVFSALAIPRKHQYRVLLWGITGAILLRGAMIGLGARAVADFHWVLYLFSAFLIFTGVNMLFAEEEAEEVPKHKVLHFCRKYMRVTERLHDEKFAVRLDGRFWFTPLMLALVVVNVVDVIFAVDSVPAILAITTDVYIVLTSNIFAILGLRALYFALDAMLHRFEYLKYALAAVLVFIGGKIFAVDFLLHRPFPPLLSLVITVSILALGVLYSLYQTRHHPHKETKP